MASSNPSSNVPKKKTIYKCPRHKAMISENELFDIVLIAGTNCVSIEAHKVVLRKFSEYFVDILRTTETNVVELKEIDAATLQPIIDFMYKGSIELSLQTVETFLRTASFLKMKTLIHGCSEFIKKNMNFNKSLKWLQLANEFNLSIDCTLECTYANFKNILKHKGLLKLSESKLKELLFIYNPHQNLEKQIFKCLVAWINYDKPNREHLVIELLSMVNFQSLTPKFILRNRTSVCKTMESYELFFSWLQWHMLPQTRMKQKAKLDFKPDKFGIICIKDRKYYNIKSWNPEENSWSSPIVSQVKNKIGCDSRIVIGNKLITIGENILGEFRKDIVKCFDLETAKWIHIPQMNKIKVLSQINDLNGHVCVFGQEELRNEENEVNIQKDWDNFLKLIESFDFPMTSTDNNSGFKPSIEMFNFSTRTWINLDLPPCCAKMSGCATTSQNGMFYCISLEKNILHTFDVVSNKWTHKIVRFPYNKRHYQLTAYGFVATEQYLYIIGGEYISNTNSNGIDDFAASGLYRYDLINNCWNEMASLPTPKFDMSCIVHKNKIIICPAEEGLNEVDEVLEYDIETNKWNTLGPLPFPMENNLYCLTHLK